MEVLTGVPISGEPQKMVFINALKGDFWESLICHTKKGHRKRPEPSEKPHGAPRGVICLGDWATHSLMTHDRI